MKDILARLSREPNLILGVVTAGLSLAVLFGVDLSSEQMAGIGLFIGAVFALVRYLTTPTNEVLAQKKPNGEIVGGGAVPELKGELVEVGMSKTSDVIAQAEREQQFPPNPDHHG
jgi:hypothetical protein